jgi:hypothetical protein
MAKKLSWPEILGFDWDKGNLHKNRLKHAVEPTECEDIFYNEPVFFYDQTHSLQEERYVAYGNTNERRMLTIVFTIRNSKIRIISARDQNKKETATYKKGIREPK